MADFTVTVNGRPTRVPVPDGLSEGGKQDWLMQNGFSAADVGLDLPEPDPIPLGTQTLLGMGETASDLFQSLQSDVRAPNTTAANIGRALAFTPTLLAPSARLTGMAAQGLISGGLSLARQRAAGESAADVDVQEAAGEAAVTSGIMGALNLAGRVFSGLSTLTKSKFSGQPQPVSLPRRPGDVAEPETAGQMLARNVAGSGGLARIATAQRRANNFAWGKAMGFDNQAARRITALDEDTLLAARSIVNRGYDAAAPSERVAIGEVRKIVEQLKADGLPDAGINNILRRFKDKATIAPEDWQGIQRTLRDVVARTRRNPTFSGLTDDAVEAVNKLDDAAAAAGGDLDMLRQANHRFKLLANTEELTDLLTTKQIPLGSELLRKLTRESFKGFGRRGTLEGTSKLDADMENFIDVQRLVARFTTETAGGSPTAARMASMGAAQESAVRGMTGLDSVAGSMLRSLVRLGLPPVLALAAIGESVGTLTRLGVVPAQAVSKAGFDPTDESPPELGLAPAARIPANVLRELERREREGEGVR